MGLLALLCTGVIGIFLGIAALTTGLISRKRIRESQGLLSGEGMATAGTIIGGVAIVVSTAFFVYVTWINPDLVQELIDQLGTTTTTTQG